MLQSSPLQSSAYLFWLPTRIAQHLVLKVEVSESFLRLAELCMLNSGCLENPRLLLFASTN